MLHWLKRLVQPTPRLVQFPDTIAMRRANAITGIGQAIESRLDSDDLVLLVAHFPSTFFELQDHLEQWGLEYEVPRSPIVSSRLLVPAQDNETAATAPRLWLLLSEMLQTLPGHRTSQPDQQVSLVVAERHPLATHDQRILEFAHQLAYTTQLGYFISLEDPAVGPFVGQWAELLLKQWGMKDADLITSDLLARRLERAHRWLERQVTSEQPADSPREWLERHGPTTRYAQAIADWLARQPHEHLPRS